MYVLTIGHSSHSLARFLELLELHGVQTVVDVRSHPASRHVPHFGKQALEAALARRGLGYRYLGAQLGGRPAAPELYDADGRVLYDRLAATPRFRQGLELLVALAGGQRVALLCAEEDPRRCHRHQLIAPALRGLGIEVLHIRGDGELQRAAPPVGVQLSLFTDDG
jgi:uncharacterized protein (DUF488 family)